MVVVGRKLSWFLHCKYISFILANCYCEYYLGTLG